MNFSLFLPECAVLMVLLTLLCALSFKSLSPTSLSRFSIFSSMLVTLASFASASDRGSLFFQTYQIDPMTQGLKLLFSLGILLTCLLAQNLWTITHGKKHEFYLLLFSSLLGMMILVSASNLLTLFVGMELSSFSLYLLSSLKTDRLSAEASVKYFLSGAFMSGLFLWGSSFVVGVSGTADLPLISANIWLYMNEPAFVLGLVLVLLSFLFKLSGFPAHFWAPDIYQSASTPVVAFIATTSKAAAVGVLIRFLMATTLNSALILWISVLAFLSMTFGNTVALVQKDVKRLLAYSSIAQAGYILLGFLSGTHSGYSALLFYVVAYFLMNAGAFLVLWVLSINLQKESISINDFNGLADRSPFMALLLLLSLLSLAGIPPLIGFTGKWFLFTAPMQKGHWFLVLWAVLNSVVSLFYYLTLVKHAYLEKANVSTPLKVSIDYKILGFLLILAMVLFGFFPDSLLQLAQRSVSGYYSIAP